MTNLQQGSVFRMRAIRARSSIRGEVAAAVNGTYVPFSEATLLSAQGFDPRRDVDAVAIEVVTLDDHVAEIDAD
jgi:hypothetical protein